MSEKTDKDLLLPSRATSLEEPPARPTVFRKTAIAFWILLGVAQLIFWRATSDSFDHISTYDKSSDDFCPQVSELLPNKNGKVWQQLSETFSSEGFKARAINWIGDAVRVPTESYDNMDPPGVDPRWEAFGPFHDYLLKAFPLIHTTLKLTKVNTYGLVYHWQGSDNDLKPILLAAHQDVVPVHPDTVDQWTHPPYSGFFDGERVWGRGSSDDKSGLIGIMAAIESLLEKDFNPTRSVVLTFGFDEEASGPYGAAFLAKYLKSTYGEDAFALLMDEGAGFSEKLGAVIATPGIAEKGYMDVRVEVSSPGGHSSLPPPHTGIGMLSTLLVHFEKNPFEVHLARDTPVYETVQCLAAHAPALPSDIKTAVKKSNTSDKALRTVEDYFFKDSAFRSLTGTTQAIDLIGGGVKTNALPEQAWAIVNHRVATESSLGALKARDTALLKSLASEFNLSFNAFGVRQSDKDAPAYGTLTLTSAFNDGLEPAPLTPTDGSPYYLLSGTIKAVYNSHRLLTGDNIVVAPGIMSGNTDTRWYWDLTKHIFRYNHHNQGNGTALLNGVHTVNESLDVDAFLEIILFFTTLILNTDESHNLN